MDEQETVRVVFDYTNYLECSYDRQLTFADVFRSLFLVERSGRQSPDMTKSIEARLWERAMDRLSVRQSDARNIVALCLLAKQEGVRQLHLMMPYSLECDQLDVIAKAVGTVERHDDNLLLTL